MAEEEPAPDRSTLGSRIVTKATEWLGSVATVLAAVLLVLAWLVGLLFTHDLENYQLILNTATSIATFVMVFIIQSAQNRDSRAMQAKLDAQNRVLAAIAKHGEVADPQELLDLVALEEAPERQIQSYQHHVRRRY
ncbi:low affinity iron permease family protein [Amycolatopsis acidiphila]|uniref:Low affinity iron permease family protein n=1 Tax=Amycolatopsis acidiphila TaxID=715473 RepID=A0A557ZYL4_9PSEU|nr:low affinity iron permease family protein [Amycolatopsis acidiphila]TVT17084.1 low affinity iron permease family protein [Amycolatopsis acidiphila]UIJ61972.1 low affinity iron permease family protein [Amycolatopsis acidiphila]GHG56826.1 hypothetical protein GCM10017788_07970 [Amycolatopsis acidiphila]